MRISGLIKVFPLLQSVYASFQLQQKKGLKTNSSKKLGDAGRRSCSILPVTDGAHTRSMMTLEEYERKCFGLIQKYERLNNELSNGNKILANEVDVHDVENAIINLNEIINDDKYDRRLSFISTDERSLMEEIKLDLIGRLVKVHVDEIVSPSQCFIKFDLTQPGDVLQLTWFYVENHDSKENFIGFIQIKADEIKKCYRESFHKLVKKLGASKDLHLNASSDLDSDSDEANTSQDSTLSTKGSLTSESLSRESAPNSPHTDEANLSKDSDDIIGTDGSSISECSQIILLADEINELDISWTSDVNVESDFVSKVESGDSGTIVDISDLKRNPLDLFISGSDTKEGGSEKYEEHLLVSKSSVETYENTEKIVSEKPFVELLENVGALDIVGDGKESKHQEPPVSTADEDGSVDDGAGEDAEKKKKKKRRNKKKAAKLFPEEEGKKSQDEESNVAPVLVDAADIAGSKSTSGAVESSDQQTLKFIEKTFLEDELSSKKIDDFFARLAKSLRIDIEGKTSNGEPRIALITRKLKEVWIIFPIILRTEWNYPTIILRKCEEAKKYSNQFIYGITQIEKYLKREKSLTGDSEPEFWSEIRSRIAECKTFVTSAFKISPFFDPKLKSTNIKVGESNAFILSLAMVSSSSCGIIYDFAFLISKHVEAHKVRELLESCFKSDHLPLFESIFRKFIKDF